MKWSEPQCGRTEIVCMFWSYTQLWDHQGASSFLSTGLNLTNLRRYKMCSLAPQGELFQNRLTGHAHWFFPKWSKVYRLFLILWPFTCCLLCLCTAEHIGCIVHGLQLHSVHCVGWQGVDGAHHRVATKLSKDGPFRSIFGRSCDLIGAGTAVAAPLHRHAFGRDRKYRQSHIWGR